MLRESCPVCDASATEPFLFRIEVPVHQNALFPTAASALGMKRGTLDMRLCSACGFAFNAAFDPRLVDYGPAYENSQDCSPAFDSYLDELVEHLVSGHGLRSGRIVEVGCGKGAFLNKLLAHPLNRSEAVGFDPSYLGSEHLGERARIVKDFYGPATAVPADAVVCRHVIEHIPEPLGLLRTVRAGVGDSGTTRVFFETPCLEWILRNRVPWDFFYEHCSLFTAQSLRLALERSGFEVSAVRRVFGGQYLWAEGICGRDASLENASHLRESVGVQQVASSTSLTQLAREFAADEKGKRARWLQLLADLASKGPTFAWGAGAKGVTFCNLADPAQTKLAGIVDVNPAKQGKYLPGTGHPIVSPQRAIEDGAQAFLVFNPNYVPEVRGTLVQLGSTAVAIDLMQQGSPGLERIAA